MKKMILLLVLSLLFGNVFSQAVDKSIRVEGRKYYHEGIKLTPDKMASLLTDYEPSKPEFELYKSKAKTASYFSLAGISCVAVGAGIGLVGTLRQVDDLNNNSLPGSYSSGLGVMGLGLLVMIIGLPASTKAKKHLNNSIDLFNQGITEFGQKKVDFDLYVHNQGVGVLMRF